MEANKIILDQQALENEMNETQHAIDLVFKVGSHTTSGYRAIIDTLNRMINDDKYETHLVLAAKNRAFKERYDMQLVESQRAWAGEE